MELMHIGELHIRRGCYMKIPESPSVYILLFLESLSDSLRMLQELLRALSDTGRLLGGQVGRGEVVDAVIETPRDQVGVQAHEVFHLLLLHYQLKFLLFFNVQLVHDEGMMEMFMWGRLLLSKTFRGLYARPRRKQRVERI